MELFDQRYEKEKLLGRGAFSEVWKVRDTQTGVTLALKIYQAIDGEEDDGSNLLTHEFALMVNMNHKSLLRPMYYAVCDSHPYLILPYCKKGNISKMVGKMTEDEGWRLLRDCANALDYLHGQKPPILHQDIKPANILMGDDGTYKLTDFGVSTQLKTTLSRMSNQEQVLSSAGTIAYMAPERFSRNNLPVMANDIYSLGATMYELLTGNLPFGNEGGLLQKKGADIPELHGDYSPLMKKTVDSCLQGETWERPTAGRLVEIADEAIRNPESRSEINDDKDEAKQKNWYQRFDIRKALPVIVALVGLGCGIIRYLMLNKEDVKPKNADSQKELTENRNGQVNKMFFRSKLGECSYTGMIDADSLPDGMGVALFEDGREYRGTFAHGKMEGKNVFFRYDNGDIFEGSFVNDSFDKGKYTVKEDGSWFVGYFKDGRPEVGVWYDKKGKKRTPKKKQVVKDDQPTFVEKKSESASMSHPIYESTHKDAFQELKEKAMRGDMNAQYELGRRFYEGKGTTKSYVQALLWFRASAVQGHAKAQYMVGYMYYRGVGTKANYVESARWYRKSAEQGDANAQNSLANMYYYGYGVDKDHLEAVKWLRKSVEQGNSSAQARLGYMYLNGYGVSNNFQEAVKWLSKSASQGNADALYKLGTMYCEGRGVPTDKAYGETLIRRAAEKGDLDAKKYLEGSK